MQRPALFLVGLAAAFCAVLVEPARAARARSRPCPSHLAARDLVTAVNAIADSDIPLKAAESTACALERLPGSLGALMPLVPVEHRRLLEECAKGRMRVQRRVDGFDLIGLIDGDEAGRRPEAATIRQFFAGRPVDVALGTGASDGPYPLGFDWVVVLDAGSETLFSFVVNCRD